MKKLLYIFSAAVFVFSSVGCTKDVDPSVAGSGRAVLVANEESAPVSDEKTYWDGSALFFLFTQNDSAWIDGIGHKMTPCEKIPAWTPDSMYYHYTTDKSDRAFMFLDPSLVEGTPRLALYPKSLFANGSSCTFENTTDPQVVVPANQVAFPTGLQFVVDSSVVTMPPMVGNLRWREAGDTEYGWSSALQFRQTVTMLSMNLRCLKAYAQSNWGDSRNAIFIEKVRIIASNTKLSGNGVIQDSRTNTPSLYFPNPANGSDSLTFTILDENWSEDGYETPLVGASSSRTYFEVGLLPVCPLPAGETIVAKIQIRNHAGKHFVVTTRQKVVPAGGFARKNIYPIRICFSDAAASIVEGVL